MIGTFTTRTFNSRLDFEAGRVADIVVSRNKLTNVGMKWMWDAMCGNLRSADGTILDHLGAARIVVGNGDTAFAPEDERMRGDQTDQAPLDTGYPRIEGPVEFDDDADGYRLVLRSTFGEGQGIFDWRERGVVTAQGVLLDRSVMDQGRKVLGAIWQIEATLELVR